MCRSMLPRGFRRSFSLAASLLLAAIFSLPIARAQTSASTWDSLGLQGENRTLTWDKVDVASVNDLVGADRFYAAGIHGEFTVSANVEAGRIWNLHEDTSLMTDYYVPTGASGAFDWHATAVGSVLAGFDPNGFLPDGRYPTIKLGIAPYTSLSSGAIATSWNTQDGEGFEITPQTFYSAYNHYFAENVLHQYSYIDPFFGAVTASASLPVDVINSSWGFDDPQGKDPYTKALDGLARAHPLTTLVVAAGNATTATSTSNNVGGPASGYNSISVGAVGNGTYNQFDMVSEFSSRGPQDYYDKDHGVIKGVRAPVDSVAPGTSIVAAMDGGQTGGNSANQTDLTGGATDQYWGPFAGTSFASPIVAGGVSLLKSLSYFTQGMDSSSLDTRVIKSVLMNSATKLPGWSNNQHLNAAGVMQTDQALDWTQGAGMLNLNRAYDQYIGGTKDVPGTGGGEILSLGWDYGSLQIHGHNDYSMHFTLPGTAILDVTLNWFRDVGIPDAPDSQAESLTVEDIGMAHLYLQIWNAEFTYLFAQSMSLYNVTQQLHFALPADGEYGIRVLYGDQMFGDAMAEDYGLAWSVEEVPEPGTVTLFGAACVTLVFWCRKRQRAFASA